ncbi:serine hydrolase [Streptomyces spectabilis]|uniref:Serine hydrolase n=1 Tax=Streptomyces spectabilis TaxID=68270 RepID=A0A516RM49_STRST|nr:serine hydrolase [Streptomyces spectabilis]QDQ16724.1 serine hydrolase [Streptomyces spectabilis]
MRVGERRGEERGVEERIREVFARAGAEGALHATRIGTTGGAGPATGRPGTAAAPARGARADVSVAADTPVAISSVFKVLLVLEFARQAAAGQLDPRERVLVTDAHRLGGWGTAGCVDDVEISLRDLAYFALTVSDNSAADILLSRVGLDTVGMLARELGLARTRIVGGPREALASMLDDVGARTAEEFATRYRALPDEGKRRLSALDPQRANASTPREVTRLLDLIWRDAAGPPEACAQVRELMGRQVFRHRLTSGFPDDVRIAAKTGTLPGLHIEAGVVRWPEGDTYAVAVFARSRAMVADLTRVDAAIGTAARIAVDSVRYEADRLPQRG